MRLDNDDDFDDDGDGDLKGCSRALVFLPTFAWTG